MSDRTLRSALDLAEAGLIDATKLEEIAEIGARYTIALSPAMRDLVGSDPASDPIARQFVPDGREFTTHPAERADPIGDDVHEVVPGLIHRYPDRVLLKLVSACAVYCRFCFRREKVGRGPGNLSRAEVERALAYIRDTPAIWEVILSGGDPLMASPARLSALMGALAGIDHVRVGRLHTRVPVVAPDLVTPDLAAALGQRDGLTTWLALHINHPQELTPEALAACNLLRREGVNLVSQTVLLKGVNDDAEVLASLFRGLVEAGIKPYYLHHPDLAPGTAHFRLPITRGRDIVADLRRKVSGLCQPVYVLDIPGGYGKVPIGPCGLADAGESGGRQSIRDPHGRLHDLPPS